MPTRFPDVPAPPDPTVPLKNLRKAITGWQALAEDLDNEGRRVTKAVRGLGDKIREFTSRRA